MQLKITELEEILSSKREKFRELFYRIYSIKTCIGKVVYPDRIEKQKIVRVTNKLTGESTLFNEVRANRPFNFEGEPFEEKEECIFCNPEKLPKDTFGRVEGKYCFTASNAAKYDCKHALIVFKEHDPIVKKLEVLKDVFSVAKKWINLAGNGYPFFVWNCLWRAGASVFHGHAHVLVSEEMYSKPAQLLRVRKMYREEYKREYLEDVYTIHRELKLGFNLRGTKIFAYLTPVKEKEVIAISNDLIPLSSALYNILKTYYSIGVKSFNVAVYMPPLNEKDFYVMRVVDRGSVRVKTSDFGGMEVFAGTSVVSSDPFILAEELELFLESDAND